MVHAEVVLQGDGGKRLRGGFHRDTLLGFDGLVQPVGIAAALHDTAGLLVHDLDFVVNHHVFRVQLEHAIGAEQLVDGMHAFGLDSIVQHQFVLADVLFLIVESKSLDFGQLGSDVGKYEEMRILGVAGNVVNPLIGEFHRVVLFVDDEIHRIGGFGHQAVIVGHIDFLGLEQSGFGALFTEVFDERFVLGQCLMCSEQRQCAFLLLVLVV